MKICYVLAVAINSQATSTRSLSSGIDESCDSFPEDSP